MGAWAVERSRAANRAHRLLGPVWEGNQVWLITGGGAIFAAWPLLYAASFSGLYLAMMLLLVALILRPVGFKFRSKMPTAHLDAASRDRVLRALTHMARGRSMVVASHDPVVLDEPTEGLDEEAERRFFLHLPDMLAGRSAVVVSHAPVPDGVSDAHWLLDNGRLHALDGPPGGSAA